MARFLAHDHRVNQVCLVDAATCYSSEGIAGGSASDDALLLVTIGDAPDGRPAQLREAQKAVARYSESQLRQQLMRAQQEETRSHEAVGLAVPGHGGDGSTGRGSSSVASGGTTGELGGGSSSSGNGGVSLASL